MLIERAVFILDRAVLADNLNGKGSVGCLFLQSFFHDAYLLPRE